MNNELIRLNIDTQSYKDKASAKQFIGAIRNRLCRKERVVEVTVDTLINCIEHGKSFTPSVMFGTSGDSWQEQRLICADIDNDNKDKNCIDNPLTPDQALGIMAAYGIAPTFMYYSLSHKEEHPKFRIVLVLDEAITDREKAIDLTQRLAQIFQEEAPGSSDTSVRDNARFFFGSTAGSCFNINGQLVPLNLLETLPKVEKPEEDPKEQEEAPEQMSMEPTPEQSTPPEAKAEGQSEAPLIYRYDELEEQVRRDIESFDLAGYIEKTETGKLEHNGNSKALYFNPCPICGHNNDFQITGSIWKCWSANGLNGKGGSIIDYLKYKHNLSLPDALDKFKFEVMGYDRKEWGRAYYEKREEETERKRKEAKATTELEKQKREAATLRLTPSEEYDAFFDLIQTQKYEPIPTGLTDLDKALGGGFIRQQEVFISAAPGMGKTVLCQQIAEQFAKRGYAVAYYNLEMSKEQMIARSISRRCDEDLSALEILQGYKLTPEQLEAVRRARDLCKEQLGNNLLYNPKYKDSNTGKYMDCKAVLDNIVESMRQLAEVNKKHELAAPIYFVDYLHLLRSEQKEDNTEMLKRAVQLFKDIAIKYNTIVFVISANNRSANSSGKSSQDSARDTSAIEYSGDVMLSLNYQISESEEGTTAKEVIEKIKEFRVKGQELPRAYRLDILRIVKSRYTQPYGAVTLEFDGKHSKFKQVQADSKDTRKKNKKDSDSDQETTNASILKARAKKEKNRSNYLEAYNSLMIKGEVTINAMAEYLGVTTSTVKRNIAELLPGVFEIDGIKQDVDYSVISTVKQEWDWDDSEESPFLPAE